MPPRGKRQATGGGKMYVESDDSDSENFQALESEEEEESSFDGDTSVLSIPDSEEDKKRKKAPEKPKKPAAKPPAKKVIVKAQPVNALVAGKENKSVPAAGEADDEKENQKKNQPATEKPQKAVVKTPVKEKAAKAPSAEQAKLKAKATPTPQKSAGRKAGKSSDDASEKGPSMKTDKDAKVVLANYLKQQGRPYSVQNIFDNLHRSGSKVMIQKVLDLLADEGEINRKEYGKAKIYYSKQEDMDEQKMRGLIEEERTLSVESAALTKKLRTLESQLKGFTDQLTIEDLRKAVSDLKAENSTREKKLETLRGNGVMISPTKKERVREGFTQYRELWAKRKRTVLDAVEKLSDCMEKKPKAVMELVGLETDEEAGELLPMRLA